MLTALRLGFLGCLLAQPSVAGPDDYVMSGATPSRNFVNLIAAGLSHEFPLNTERPKEYVLGNRMKWKAQLGSRAYGGPTVAGGRIFVGTNNENPRNKRDRGKPTDDEPDGHPKDKGVLMCFDEKTGVFLWQAIHDKLESGQVNDWPREGVCSIPTVEGDRVYYVSNRCEVMCLDVKGFADGNDGFKDEQYRDKTDADIIWRYDLIKEQNVFPHNMSDGSPLIVGDLLYVVTANGVDDAHVKIPSPNAPSFVCLSKTSGRLIWKSNLPDKAIMHGNWSHPAYGVFQGKPQVIFPGGDGWVYSFVPETGKLIWKFDANRKDSTYELGGRGTKSHFIGMPTVYNGRIYIAVGQDPEHFDGEGHLWCIDPTREGDISSELVTDAKVDPPKTKPNPNSGAVWHFGGPDVRPHTKRDIVFGRSMSTPCIVDDIVYISDVAGYVYCVDARSGKQYWQWDTKSAVWASCYYVDGKVLVANEDGQVFFFKHEKSPVTFDEVGAGSNAAVASEAKATKEGLDKDNTRKATLDARDRAITQVRAKVKDRYLLRTVEMEENVRTTPIVANGVLYIVSEKTLFAINFK